jgi:hypothetical protein
LKCGEVEERSGVLSRLGSGRLLSPPFLHPEGGVDAARLTGSLLLIHLGPLEKNNFNMLLKRNTLNFLWADGFQIAVSYTI